MSTKRNNGIKFFNTEPVATDIITMDGIKHTQDAYNKGDYKWDPQLKKTVYVGKKQASAGGTKTGNASTVIGSKVPNNIKELSKKLKLTNLEHIGNFEFEGMRDGQKYRVVTMPVDEDEEKIIIHSIYKVVAPRIKRT